MAKFACKLSSLSAKLVWHGLSGDPCPSGMLHLFSCGHCLSSTDVASAFVSGTRLASIRPLISNPPAAEHDSHATMSCSSYALRRASISSILQASSLNWTEQSSAATTLESSISTCSTRVFICDVVLAMTDRTSPRPSRSKLATFCLTSYLSSCKRHTESFRVAPSRRRPFTSIPRRCSSASTCVPLKFPKNRSFSCGGNVGLLRLRSPAAIV